MVVIETKQDRRKTCIRNLLKEQGPLPLKDIINFIVDTEGLNAEGGAIYTRKILKNDPEFKAIGMYGRKVVYLEGQEKKAHELYDAQVNELDHVKLKKAKYAFLESLLSNGNKYSQRDMVNELCKQFPTKDNTCLQFVQIWMRLNKYKLNFEQTNPEKKRSLVYWL